jgi:serine protease AprX
MRRMKKCFPAFLFFIFNFFAAWCQIAPHIYWVQFTDKNYSNYSLSRPLEFLSQKSLDRRARQGLALSESDLPVTKAYLDSIKNIGGKVLFTSRWQNAAAVFSPDSLFLQKAGQISVVKSGMKIYKTGLKVHSAPQNMMSAVNSFSHSDYGQSFEQVHLHEGDVLHNNGFRGNNMIIGILDAGFYHVDSLKAFEKLRARKGILGTRDMVSGSDSVFGHDVHGMYVLSVIGGYLPGKLIGTAPDADFYLYRTEISASETELEEATWVAGMENADSAGVEVVNSSLGYTQFDDPKMNHYYTDLDGHTTICSREASMAASKGIILVNSAGNNGNHSWYYVSAPADAENILTVGAVDHNKVLAAFSSRGPTYDGRLKPDVCAMGRQTISASVVDGEVAGVNGTSLAAPVITGLVACLWQQFPEKTSFEIMDAVKKSSDHYANPNDSLGDGIPDFNIAGKLLNLDMHEQDFLGDIYPNPFNDNFTVSFYTTKAQQANVTLINSMGQIIWTSRVQTADKNFTSVNVSPSRLAHGLYLVSVKTSTGNHVQKIMKQ